MEDEGNFVLQCIWRASPIQTNGFQLAEGRRQPCLCCSQHKWRPELGPKQQQPSRTKDMQLSRDSTDKHPICGTPMVDFFKRKGTRMFSLTDIKLIVHESLRLGAGNIFYISYPQSWPWTFLLLPYRKIVSSSLYVGPLMGISICIKVPVYPCNLGLFLYVGNKYLLSGATIATLLMLGGLHARRLYDDKKSEQARQQGIEPEFHPDLKAAFLQILPLRFFSRLFGTMTSVELPIWSRSYIFRSYARAFHANLEEVAEKLDDYASLQSFFTRKLKEGCRPIDSSSCVISPVDGVILRCGEVSTRGRAIEQVKGYSYSLKALLGGQPHNLLTSTSSNMISADEGSSTSSAELLFPVNERATRTIGSLYTGNERVVLEGSWEKGFIALVAVGAFNVGSIELKVEPDLKTNLPKLLSATSSPVNFKKYGDDDSGFFIRKGDELAAFNLGSTVVLVFQAPKSGEKKTLDKDGTRGFEFCVKQGQRVRMGQAIGRWE
ncbi:hypothetical protein KP509_03G034100 [Ceratopteris richardii]|uniref:Phosphatidylserine decarboxylase n=1 Tax=Ceratopteris richardii TaxID=49495 RepID=A0A8T2V639_CERRI|nr:hypothetical protein KP509_03G034100 [Ceratopteris richardii]